MFSQAFLSKEFQVQLQYYPIIELSKGIYQNISKSGLYRAVTKPSILPCPDGIEWLTQKVDHESMTLLDLEGNHVASYQDPILNQMYHFKEAQIKVTQEWLQNKFKSINCLDIMKGW